MVAAARVKRLGPFEALVQRLLILSPATALLANPLAPGHEDSTRQQQQERDEACVGQPLLNQPSELSESAHRSSFPQRQHIVNCLKIAEIGSPFRGTTERHW